MNFSEVFDIVKQLILDWRIIVSFVVVFLYLNFIFYVSRYRKSTVIKRRFLRKKVSAEVPESAPPAEGSNE